MKINKRECLALLVCVAVILFVLITGVLDRQKTWEDMPFLSLSFHDGRSRDITAGDDYGVMNGGPGFDLPAGVYRLKYYIESDGNNRIEIVSENQAKIVPGEILLSADMPQGEAVFSLHDAVENIEIRVIFEDGTQISVLDMRMYSPMYRDYAFAFAGWVLAAYVLYILYVRGWLTPQRRGKLVLLSFAVMLASGPAFKDTINIGHDSVFHLVRLCNVADGLKYSFPVRIGGYFYNGYGSVTSVFYSDIFLYPFAMLMNAGASLQFSTNLFFVAVNAASAASMYVAAKRIFQDEWAGVCASVLYTFSIYRVSDVFSRYAFGEMTAMIFLPLFLLGLYEVVLGDKHRWILLGVSASCIFFSHMLSTLVCALTAVGFCALFIVNILKEGRLFSIVKAMCVAGLLCTFQLVPFLMYSTQGLGAQMLTKDAAFYAIHPAQLFMLGEGELGVDPRDPGLATFALEIGLPLFLGAMLALYVAVTAEKREKNNGFAALLVLAGGVFALMSTKLFPWSHVRVITGGLSDYLQFPWRLLMMTSVFFALAGGYGCAKMACGYGAQMTAGVLAIACLCALPTLTDETRNPQYIGFGETISPILGYYEYTIPGSNLELTNDTSVKLDEGVSMTTYEKVSTTVTAQVAAQKDSKIQLPLFGYDGYRAEVDGEVMKTELGDNNRLTVCLPAGTQGELRVWFEGKLVWRIAEGISLLTALLLGFYGKRAHKMRRRNDE